MNENLMKENRGTILVTSVVTLLPTLIGVLLWKRLPERMPSHFNLTGNVDGTMGRASMVFLFPAFLLAMHLLTAWVIARDPKHGNLTPKVYRLALWIVPVLSLVLAALIYPTALGYGIDANRILALAEGAILLFFGNYLPKCRPNYTVGIRLPWTLEDEENWNRTHRMAGPIWVIGGLVMILSALLPVPSGVLWIILIVVLLPLILIPTIYSYRFYRAKKKD